MNTTRKNKTSEQTIWCAIYFLRNIFVVSVVFLACIFKKEEAINFLNFLSGLMVFVILASIFAKQKLLNFLKTEKQRSQKIVYFSRASWWLCIIFFAMQGWIFSAMLWFSAWFIIYNLKNQIKI